MKPPNAAKEVTREEFFKVIGPLDVHPTPLGNWPYLTVFKTRSGEAKGWSKLTSPPDKDKYFLP